MRPQRPNSLNIPWKHFTSLYPNCPPIHYTSVHTHAFSPSCFKVPDLCALLLSRPGALTRRAGLPRLEFSGLPSPGENGSLLSCRGPDPHSMTGDLPLPHGDRSASLSLPSARLSSATSSLSSLLALPFKIPEAVCLSRDSRSPALPSVRAGHL